MTFFYRSYNQYLQETFSSKVYKVAIDADFTCPNIDGTVAFGGCTFCDNKAFSVNTRLPPRPIREQVEDGITFYREHSGAEKFIVYFQAFSNTHAPVEKLKILYDEALNHPDVIGLSIGTRPDCASESVLDLLAEYHKRTHLWIEYGLQSVHDHIMAGLNRAHSYEQFLDAVSRTKARGIPICTHAILGLPGETPEMMMETAEAIAGLNLDGIKVHHLYLARNSALARIHRDTPVRTLELNEYIGLACDFIERLPPPMVIQRLMGELSPELTIAPVWGLPKSQILSMINNEFERRGTRQGSRYSVPVS